MEIFILDALLREIDLVDADNYESFVWTERYAEKGDFQIVALSTTAMRNKFAPDTMISIRDSKRIMRVNTIEEKIDEEKGATLTIEGDELVSILEQRVSASKASGGDHDGMILSPTYFNGWTPLELIDDLVWRICIPTSGWALSAGDYIPFLNDSHTTPGSLYPVSNIPQPAPGGILWEQKLASVYSAVTDVCKAYDLGFRLYKDPSSAKLYFEGYQGCDRTTEQTVFPPVVFSSDMENLLNTTEYRDNMAEFNVVMCVYEYQNEVEGGYPTTLTISGTASDPELAFSSGGFDQKTKVITVSQLPDSMTDPTDIYNYLVQMAQEELTRSKATDIQDGEVDPRADFVYERDYNLGDIVEYRGDTGATAFMRVTEHITKFDVAGKASYPSLVAKGGISPGTWKSWKYAVDWNAMGAGEYWNNQ